jgi:hypothetical protein
MKGNKQEALFRKEPEKRIGEQRGSNELALTARSSQKCAARTLDDAFIGKLEQSDCLEGFGRPLSRKNRVDPQGLTNLGE